MATPRGRPTQFHGVPVEDRAVDASGTRLPWALEWADDQPDARLASRVPEEKGAFGKALRRKGSSRSTRTQTPARRENATLDAFAAALKYDESRRPAPPTSPPTGSDALASNAETGAALAASATTNALHKQPTEVLLYGFSSALRYAAIDYFERVSGGMICEDYAREPRASATRFSGNAFGNVGRPRRALTSAELALSRREAGGACWIKVTFDSHEAADRAVQASPAVIRGHWVSAQFYQGAGPAEDRPVLKTDASSPPRGLLAGSRGPKRASLSAANLLSSPSPFSGSLMSLPESGQADIQALGNGDDLASTSSTVDTSSTALAAPDAPATTFLDAPDLADDRALTSSSATLHSPATRRVNSGQSASASALNSSSFASPPARTPAPRNMKFFPDTPRTTLKPASAALLPSPTWLERLLQPLVSLGWMPGNVIGSVVPRRDDDGDAGAFDAARASLYWRFWHWVDSWLGTDLCAMQEG